MLTATDGTEPTLEKKSADERKDPRKNEKRRPLFMFPEEVYPRPVCSVRKEKHHSRLHERPQ